MLYDVYLFFLLAIKIIFIVSVIQNRFAPSPVVKERIERFENIFKVGVSLLMVYLFAPGLTRSPVLIDKVTKIYLFIFALLTVFDFWKEEKKEDKANKEKQ